MLSTESFLKMFNKRELKKVRLLKITFRISKPLELQSLKELDSNAYKISLQTTAQGLKIIVRDILMIFL